MAQFKKLTLHGTNEKVVINMEEVQAMRSYAGSTSIQFSDTFSDLVAETLDQTLRTAPLQDI